MTPPMSVHDALKKRSSIRQFKPDPLDDAVLRRILAAALEAPSWSNTQPYMIAAANGPRCDAIRKDLLDATDSIAPDGDYPLLMEYPTPLKERRQATGYGLYEKLGIARDDREGRAKQFRKNFAFFDAPCALFVFAHDALGYYSVLDAGFFIQSLLLAATAEGVGSCAQAALASYPQIVRKHFDVPERYKLLCGVALGYAADDVVNTFRPTRLPVDSILIAPRG